ncbi:MAG: CRISPR system precrRNA processing endoribonuclease RAMP protein Cas6 [Candidatus Promineifilaceae bacterium]
MNSELTLTHLRFEAVATTPLDLGRWLAGNNLRNALAAVMRRATCPETYRLGKPSPEHLATCPACWLLAAEVDPGSVVRAYSLAPPLPLTDVLEPGGRFAFGLTLFGNGIEFLPYFVLALHEVGRVGVGHGRGKFAVEAITAINPLLGQMQIVLAPGEKLVRVPNLRMAWPEVAAAADSLLAGLGEGDLTVRFLTPTRLEEQEKRPIQTPDFAIFFRRLLYRIDDLGRQFAGQPRRPAEEVERLTAAADRVRLVECRVRWLDLWSWSGRAQKEQPVGGLVGWATYQTADWRPLLPWLVLGQATQVGKLTVKGNGVYELTHVAVTGYWQWLAAPANFHEAAQH